VIDVTCHVIRCRLSQDRRMQTALDDVASKIWLTVGRGGAARPGADGV